LLTAPHASVNGKEIFAEPPLFSMLLTTLPTYADVQGTFASLVNQHADFFEMLSGRISKTTFHPLAVDTTLEFIKAWISAYPSGMACLCDHMKY
jgi:hypothetical protein